LSNKKGGLSNGVQENAPGSARIAQDARKAAIMGEIVEGGMRGGKTAAIEQYRKNKKFNDERPSLDKGEKKPAQTGITNPQELRDKAAKHIEELRSWVNSIAEKHGARVMERPVSDENPLPLKTVEGIQRKLDKGDLISEILDVMGMTIIAKDFKSMINIAEDMQKKDEVVRIKDRWKSTDPSGYRDFLTNVELSDGMIAEVQINTEQMLAAKQEYGGHAIYEIARVLGKEGQDKIDYDILQELSTKFYNEALDFSLSDAYLSASSLDIDRLLNQISSTPYLDGVKVLSEETSKKLLDSIATGRSSASTNSNLGSSNEGIFTSDISLPSTSIIDTKTNPVKQNQEKKFN
jgi:hypothetical protein